MSVLFFIYLGENLNDDLLEQLWYFVLLLLDSLEVSLNLSDCSSLFIVTSYSVFFVASSLFF